MVAWWSNAKAVRPSYGGFVDSLDGYDFLASRIDDKKALDDFLDSDTPDKMLRFAARYGNLFASAPNFCFDAPREFSFASSTELAKCFYATEDPSKAQIRKAEVALRNHGGAVGRDIDECSGVLESRSMHSDAGDSDQMRCASAYTSFEQLSDYVEARETLLLAIALRALLDSGCCDLSDLERLGFSIERFDTRIEANRRTILLGKAYASFLCSACLDEQGAIDEGKMLVNPYKGESPRYYLKGTPEGYFSLGSLDYGDSEEGRLLACADIMDTLCTAHLYAVREISVQGGSIRRAATNLIGTLWAETLDRFIDGRSGICEYCGRPFVAKKERGSKRKYCSTNCRKASSRKSSGH